ncbi:MAG: bifunctional riboflavin kinase/FMN adenylyltransferase [Planctomycetota bacterium]
MPQRCVLTLGNFDGPHVGHLAILRCARTLADTHRARVVALTFDPPPVQVLRPGQQPPALTPLAQRLERLRRGGADDVHVLTPTPELLARSPEQFIKQLVERYHPIAIVEGPDFRFGKDRAGDMQTLADLGRSLDFEAVTVPRLETPLHDLTLAPVSSSLVRWLVGRGRVADAARCLGEPFSLTAPIIRGEQRGRQLGIPTANLDPDTLAPYILPADGVYAGTAELLSPAPDPSPDSSPEPERSDPSPRFRPAAISIGIKPTFGQKTLTVEAHLLDYHPPDADGLYGRTLTLRFARWVRDQYPFPGVQTLRQQLHRDLQQTRRWHADGMLTPSVPPAPVKA